MSLVAEQVVEVAGEDDFIYETLPELSLYTILKYRCSRFIDFNGLRTPENILDNERRLILSAASEVVRRAGANSELERFVAWLYEDAPESAYSMEMPRERLIQMYQDFVDDQESREPDFDEIEVPEYGMHPGAVIREYD